MWGSNITREQLLQKISLLAILGPIKDAPMRHKLTPFNETSHRLTIEQEGEIVDNLAFLSYRRKDSQNVTALCMEEDESGEGMLIRLAVNGCALSQIEHGLRQICLMLEEVAQRESYDLEEFLERVIVLDFSRIAARLKLGKKYQEDRSPVVRLQKALHEKGYTKIAGLAALQQKSKQILDLYRILKNSATSPPGSTEWHLAKELIKLTHELSWSPELHGALAQSSLNKSQRNDVLDGLGKLAQYYRASYKLMSAARRKTCKLFRRIRVESFQIEVPKDVRSPSYPGSALPLVRSLFGSPRAQTLVKRLGGSEYRANTILLNRLDGTRLGIKVHAEIKLLFFYETHPRIRRPRVICASKDACYLCDLFFRVHGRFQILRTFGKLNERWILPDWLSNLTDDRLAHLKATTEEFSSILDSQITRVLKKTQRPDPMESTLCLSAIWSDATSRMDSSSTNSNTRVKLHTNSQNPFSLLSHCTRNSCETQLSLRSHSSTLTLEDVLPSAAPLMDGEILHPGTTTKKQITGDRSFVLHVRRTSVALSFDAEGGSKKNNNGLLIYVSLFAPAAKIDSSRTEQVVSLDRIQEEGVTLKFDENEPYSRFSIRWRNQIISFKLRALGCR